MVSQSSTSERGNDVAPGSPADELAESSPRLSPQDAVDFLLHPSEIARGLKAAENYLETCRNAESRRFAKEALETLATVISGGLCDSVEFPWQQVRPFHGAAALTILKGKGAPARIEALRCRRDLTRSYRVVPESYTPSQVQKIRMTLNKVIAECSDLGFVMGDPSELAGRDAKKTKASVRGRLLGDGELRALAAACAASNNSEGYRDAVFFSLVNCGLKIAEITALTIDSVRFSNKTGACHIGSLPTSGSTKLRRVELSNDELISLEDWLDHRGDGDGPLLCTIGRAGKVEGKRLTIAILKEVCAQRARQAEVADFVPNDLSRSATALVEHRKATRRRVAREAQDDVLKPAEHLLLVGRIDASSVTRSKAIRFPFQGLGI